MKKYYCEKYFYDEECGWDDEPTIFAFTNKKDRDEYVDNNVGCEPINYEDILNKDEIIGIHD